MSEQVWQAGREIIIQLDQHIPWRELLGETEVSGPENDVVWATAEEIVGGCEGLQVGAKVTLNTDPDNWRGVDGGCQRVTCWLNGKTGTVTRFEPPYVPN